jgi:hypothetical protein
MEFFPIFRGAAAAPIAWHRFLDFSLAGGVTFQEDWYNVYAAVPPDVIDGLFCTPRL